MNKYRIDQLSLEEKIGQLFIVGFDSLEVDDTIIQLVKQYKIGNFILFTRNIEHPKQLYEFTCGLHKLTQDTFGITPFICIDQEGGMVTRIKSKMAYYPGAMTLCASNDPINAYLTGKHMGEDLERVGINLNLAPVLDVNVNPYNPVIGVRSYSDDPDIVGEYGLHFIQGLQEHVIATGKHFPGHGDTRIDSHLSLPTITVSQERFTSVELKPFVHAINGGLKAIMSSHVIYPGITEDALPSTLSKKCLSGLLRNELHFEGLILTDCMEMKAIQNNFTTKEGALMSILAGANLVGISHTLSLQIAAIERVKEAVLSGELSMEILDERVLRILNHKNNLKDFDFSQPFEMIKESIENEAKKSFSRNVVSSAVTLIKGDLFHKSEHSMLIAFEPGKTSIADETGSPSDIVSAINDQEMGIDAFQLGVNPDDDEIDSILSLSLNYDQIVICEYNSNQYPSQIQLIDRLTQSSKEIHVFSMRNPYVLFLTKNVRNYVCFYEYTPNSLFALIEYLKGNLNPRGKVPVKYD